MGNSKSQANGIVACLVVFGGLAALYGFIFWNSTSNVFPEPNKSTVSSGLKPDPVTHDPKLDLQVSDVGEDRDGNITGTVTNIGDHKFSYVQVEINLLDKSKAVVDSTMANVNNLDAHQKWKFEAPVIDHRRAKSFEVKAVDGL